MLLLLHEVDGQEIAIEPTGMKVRRREQHRTVAQRRVEGDRPEGARIELPDGDMLIVSEPFEMVLQMVGYVEVVTYDGVDRMAIHTLG